MAYQVEEIWPARAFLGEGAIWSDDDQALYWVDIHPGLLHRYDPATDGRETWQLPEKIGCVVPESRGVVIAAMQNGFARLDVQKPGQAPGIERINDPEADLPNNRFNDGKRAPDGSIWAGTMQDAETEATGNWWRLDVASGTTRKLNTEPFMVTNGPAFDAARDRVYLTDSAKRRVYVSPLVDGGAGFGGLETHLQFEDADGYPDGMTVAQDGSLWIAFWAGHCIRRFSPDGQRLDEVPIPAENPTTVTFDPSGALYVTSAGLGKGGPGDGGLYRVAC
jgi:xylono-1,5-lactonase